MGRITFVAQDDLEKEFRELIKQKYGGKRGAIGAALNEAMKMWIAKAKADLKHMKELEMG